MRDIQLRHSHSRDAIRRALAAVLLGCFAGCSPRDLVGTASFPTGLSDPGATETPTGAMAAYRGTIIQFRDAFSSYVLTSGLLGDELQNSVVLGQATTATGLVGNIDARRLPEFATPSDELAHGGSSGAAYSALQKVRGQGNESLGLLRDFAPNTSPALRGHLYALQAYSEVMLSELYCSGVPLSTLNYSGDYTLRAGSSMIETLTDAEAMFDTSLTLSVDSARIMNLARVGRARTLLDLGQVAEAAQAVAEVPDGFRYEVSYTAINGANAANFAQISVGVFGGFTVSDHEGVNGLPYRSSNDSRTASSLVGTNIYGAPIYHPDKYATDGSSAIVLADWVEARLIESEAALQAGNVGLWLGTLNHLRETAITPALPDTTDPVAPDARLDLLYHERAYWLFLTGHRQGDLRRLIRQYGRGAEQVYPSGAYSGQSAYGTDVTVPIPASERVSNPNFTGCMSRGA